ncbi:HsdR family type I site-specific deoxyribonuclease [Frankia sp. R82]|uniref:HsdR family type I site-specific deoxyribonuclease n=1 Tax=Frankia sp. R82 TaxID=2950553 RepID=UPI0020433982|nr:HsdR family type I site-specific deoxyribonuclease [Frankia sp. R82]MCM3883896.1 HsdR family type I site-specific deoxyribonuclease [Frankia sp. R82]
MPSPYTEGGLVERPALELLEQLGWTVVNAFSETFGPAGTLGRDSRHDVVLTHRLRDALHWLNPQVPEAIREEALTAVVKDRSVMDRVRANQEVYDLIRDGFRAEWQGDDGERQYATVQYIDLRDSANNDWLAASQVWVAGDLHRRRADTVLFVNGIPLVLMEFKDPNRPVKAAYDENLADYRDTVPQLFVPNGFVLLSNGSEAKVGSTYSPWEFFGDWKVIDADGTRGVVALETAIRGTCAQDRLLDLIENFVAFIERPGGLIKVVSRNHQVLGVNAAIDNLYRVRAAGDRRLGVFWHTQGSGKSLSMLWFTQKVLRRIPGAWTFVMVTDRTELDVQLHGEFADAGAISREANVHASSAANLRELLAADHRYVFTLIHKFRLNPAAGETTMPVLSDRSDVIVITDEAHRSQYDTLALNMRRALPNASFMGFTGTPLIVGEELTRQQFGDYVSTYNFRDAIEDGATVPLYYENRIPELQLINEDFADDLADLLEAAELDEDAEGQLARRFGRQYALLTRPERLRQVARDLVVHFVGRGFTGKAMYVGLDKAAAVRMYDFVREAWAEHLADLRTQHDALPELERPWLASRIELMETTDMAVVVSQGQNEIATLDRQGLDIRPHRARMNTQDLAEKFKAADDPLRLVFVCAMWMTGFDAPSVSTIYLDRPMRNHTLMQTIARANRVFPDKDNGLIVDYIGVFRNLEKALAIYGAANADVDSPIQDLDALVEALNGAVDTVVGFCESKGVDLLAMRDAKGFAHIALRDAAVDNLLADDDTRTTFLAATLHVRKLFKALLPDPKAAAQQNTVAAIRVLAERVVDVSRPPKADLDSISDAVEALLDRSVGAEEYVIRAAAEGSEPDPLIDLSQIDFDGLAAKFAGRKRAETDRLAALLKQRAVAAATRNPTRYDLVQRIEELIADYNAGSVNIDEYLRRLIELSKTLNDEEQRAVAEGLTEEETAVFDLLTKPEPTLTDAERDVVKASAKRLLAHLHDKLVLDWRRRAATTADVRVTIRDVLDTDLPEDPYPPELFDIKVQAVFDHVITAYGDDGSSVYVGHSVGATTTGGGVATLTPPDIESIADSVVERIRTDAEFASRVADQLVLAGGAALRTVEEILTNEEDFTVEFKSTARWDLREGKPNKAMEDAVVKTVAGFLNTDGGTLLIGVDDSGAVLGLDHDYDRVRPKNGDGFVNWLTTHLINALGHPPVTRIRARIVVHGGKQLCRVDVARHSEPVWAKTSKAERVLFARFNNSTRSVPPDEAEAYVGLRWPA